MKQLIALPVILLAGCSATPSLDLKTHQLCEQTLYQYTKIRDKGTTKQYTDLFTQDATFNVEALNVSLSGHQELAQRFDSARAKNKSIHLLTSSRIFTDADQKLSAYSNFILYLQNKSSDSETKVLAGRYLDTLEATDSTCKFKHREVLVDRVDIL
ncbi:MULTISPECIES: nuclear transport factor 2 family protein [Pseudoalteromonas]|uniref:Nuclear transport factor 2 family protein n=1 Tax=Pseudoalteromonas obscura TaxID=3048491 RepID=A0ABT7EE62_9GAMM|nr:MULTISPECIES: nuclear transport factor 2 family protein [Pseudoalteromonas]MBQ4838522.1 nuclear transport factor 2 family protein [Pseudoalteromonas luteoviolacea]MDK2593566.1 nuclear transport factor 2 family protein [Pseudoalteromonas sp. P94(2023)]